MAEKRFKKFWLRRRRMRRFQVGLWQWDFEKAKERGKNGLSGVCVW